MSGSAAGANVAGTGMSDAGTSGTGTGTGGTGAPLTGVQALPAVTDYAQPGPFKTTMTANVGPGNNYTIFRPEPLGANGFLHSPIIFGPGIATVASFYSAALTHFASHGFVTICVNSMSGGPGDPGNLKAMQDGLEWIIAQNGQAGVFQGKLAVDRAVAMGYSIGAGASVQLSSHKAIMTTVVIHDHSAAGDPHGPVLMLTGTMDVIDDMRKTLTTLDEAPAVLVALPIGHLDVLAELAMLTTISPSARYIAPITAWLRYWVNGDQAAKRFFWGDNCEMCKSPWITPEPNAKWSAQAL
jgi:dienelactone hydrolase